MLFWLMTWLMMLFQQAMHFIVYLFAWIYFRKRLLSMSQSYGPRYTSVTVMMSSAYSYFEFFFSVLYSICILRVQHMTR